MTNLHNGEKETERKLEKNEGIKGEEREEVKDKENKKSLKERQRRKVLKERQRRKVLKERQTDLYKASEDAVGSKYVIDHRSCITVKQYRGV